MRLRAVGGDPLSIGLEAMDRCVAVLKGTDEGQAGLRM